MGGRRWGAPPPARPPSNPKNNKNQKISRVRGRVGERGRRRAGASPSLPATLLLDHFFLSFSLRLVSFHPITGGESVRACVCALVCARARARARLASHQKKKVCFCGGRDPALPRWCPPLFFHTPPTIARVRARMRMFCVRARAARTLAFFFPSAGEREVRERETK